MKQDLIKDVIQGMLPYLNNAQNEKLQEVLKYTLANYEVTENQSKEKYSELNFVELFLSAKRIEGCSEKSLKYYKATIEAMLCELKKDVKHIVTDDIRGYLTEYQEKKKSSKVTIDNIRRILSSFFSWLEDEDYILKSPVRRIHRVKTGMNIKETYSDEALELMRDNCSELRDLAIIDMLASTGMRVTDSNLNHTGIYLYSKGKIMIHLTFDYKTDEKCTTPGQYLKYHRTFQGFTTRELAEKVGIVPATLVLYENDRHPIKHSTAVALANALGIDRNRLLDKYTAFVDYPYSSLLKKVRQELSLTQMQMAEVIGIGQTSYSGWEREIRVPRRKEYEKSLPH